MKDYNVKVGNKLSDNHVEVRKSQGEILQTIERLEVSLQGMQDADL